MDVLKLLFWGPFRVSKGEQPVGGFESTKVRGLLAYLAVESARPHSRDSLASLFWPDWPDSAARSNLRYALANLRKSIGDQQAIPPYLHISRNVIQFNIASRHWLDVAEFVRLKDAGDEGESSAHCVERLEQALALYQSEFLEGFALPDNARFEEWLRARREEFHRQRLQALHRLAETYEQLGVPEKALPYARQQVESEPWQEEAQRQLIRMLALNGQRSAALAQYEACARIMASELRAEPAEETRHLVESIRNGQFAASLGVEQPLAELPPAPGAPPFMGLQFFDEKDADLYFGRETLVAHLIGQLKPSAGKRFLAVVGASGSGKSSLVQAGLVPAIRNWSMLANGSSPPRHSHRWLIHVITPTAHPLEALATSLTCETDSVSATATLIDDFYHDPRSLHLYAKRLTHIKRAPLLLLVVDQFEELFTLCQDETERATFIENLLLAAGTNSSNAEPTRRETGPLVAVITLRADFYHHCSQYARLRTALSAHQEFIGQMDQEELRRAIEEPALRNGWKFEPGLVELILREIGSEPGSLPLLSHALLETWHRRRGRTLTLKGYAESGGIHGAIAQTAESVYTRLTPENAALARRIFLRLTELGEGTQDTRRRTGKNELVSAGSSPQVEELLNTLIEARLVTASEATVEVAHEALIREWPRLREWLNQDREGLRLHRHLTEAAQAWERMNRDPGELYRGARLAQMVEWVAQPENAAGLTSQERAFLTASKDYQERGKAEREAQRQRELDSAHRAFEAYLVAASVNNSLSKGDPELSILLALKAMESRPSDEAESALRKALLGLRIEQVLTCGADALESLHYNMDGTRLVADSEDGEIFVWDAATGKLLLDLPEAQLRDPVFSPDGSQIAANHGDYFNVTNAATGEESMRFPARTFYITPPVFSPDGKQLITPTHEGTVLVWDIHTRHQVVALRAHVSDALAYISPNGKYLVTTCEDCTAIFWDTATWQPVRTLTSGGMPFTNIDFRPDSTHLALSNGSEIIVQGLASGENLLHISGVGLSVAYSPDGTRLATGIAAKETRVLDAQTGALLLTLPGNTSAMGRLSFSPDNTHLATPGKNGKIIIWNISPEGSREVVTVCNPDGMVGRIAAAPDASSFATTNYDGTVQVWDTTTGREIRKIQAHTGAVWAEDYSPDGRCLVTGGADSLVNVWNLDTGQRLLQMKGHEDLPDYKVGGYFEGVLAVAFSPDCSKIASGGEDGTVKLWDASSGALLQSLDVLPTHNGVTNLCFSPDGTLLAAVTDGSESADPGIAVWAIATLPAQEIFRRSDLSNPGYRFWGLAFSPAGQLVVGDASGVIRFITIETEPKVVAKLSDQTGRLMSIVYSADRTIMATSSRDGTVKIRDGTTGAPIKTIQPGQDLVFIALSRDGKYLFVAGWEVTARVFLVRTEDLLTLARSRLTRGFTLEECQKYLHLEHCPTN